MEKDYFPRGGAKEAPVIQYKKFVFEKKTTPKRQKKRKVDDISNNAKNYRNNSLNLSNSFRGPQTHHKHLKYSDISSGFQCICAVHSIFDDRLVINLPYEMRGYVLQSSISNQYSQVLKSSKTPMSLSTLFHSGQLISCKIIEKPSKDTGAKQNIQIYATTDPSAVNWNLNSGMVKEHAMIQMAVSSVEDRGYMMESGIAGVMAFLPLEQAAKYTKSVFTYKKKLSIGTLLWCYVVKSNTNSSGGNFVEVRICHDATFELQSSSPSNILYPGSRVNTTITKVFDDGCCQVVVDGTEIQGVAHSQLDFNKDPSQEYFVGTGIKATVMTFSPYSEFYHFSFSHHVYKPLLSCDRSFKETCEAIVDKVNKFVIWISLVNKHFKGLVPVKSILKNREENDTSDVGYEQGDLVEVKIVNTDFLSRKYICNITSKLDRNELDEIKIKEEDENSDFSSEKSFSLMDNFAIKEESQLDIEMINDSIQIKEERNSSDEDDSGIETSKHLETKSKKKNKKKKNKKGKEEKEPEQFIEFKRDNSFEEFEKSEEPTKKRKSKTESGKSSKKIKISETDDTKPTLSQAIKEKIDAAAHLSLKQVDSEFLWEATPDDLAKATTKDLEEFNEESDEENLVKKPLTKKQKKANVLEKERKIQEKEDELLKALEDPKSSDHFERLILSRPDDSRVWIKYMAFHLEATEIEKARAVGNRALKLITHRNEQDRLNVWLALLNLEHLYGSKELFKETWTEALKFNDDFKVNCKVLDMYAGSQNTIEVNSLVQRMIKQYRENFECWYVCLGSLMTASMEEKARALLQRALKSLPAKSHVTLISRFALLENSHGHSEEAQALFDNLLTSYPTRVDIWFVYIDMLIKSNQMDLTRQVFERATSMKLPAKKMKSLYKKWLEFEEKHGDAESVEAVRKSAVDYVEKATKEIGV